MNTPIMRAKLRVSSTTPMGTSEFLILNAVAKREGYGADGADENNSFARWTPSAEFKIQIDNPSLHGKFSVGQEYYADFTLVSGVSGSAPMDAIGHEVIANKELRRDIDAQLQKLKELPPSRERSLAITKLQEAVMWLGMDLKRLNEPNPYPNSKDPSNVKIDPTADGLKL